MWESLRGSPLTLPAWPVEDILELALKSEHYTVLMMETENITKNKEAYYESRNKSFKIS